MENVSLRRRWLSTRLCETIDTLGKHFPNAYARGQPQIYGSKSPALLTTNINKEKASGNDIILKNNKN